MPVEGSAESKIIEEDELTCSSCWALTQRGMYLLHQGPLPLIRFCDFSTGQLSLVARLRRSGVDLTATPDGRRLVFAQKDGSSNVMYVPHFQ